jgi:hypothetical protein
MHGQLVDLCLERPKWGRIGAKLALLWVGV